MGVETYTGTVMGLKMLDGNGKQVRNGAKYSEGTVKVVSGVHYLVIRDGFMSNMKIIAPFGNFVRPESLQ